jgi:hypothetical protein
MQNNIGQLLVQLQGLAVDLALQQQGAAAALGIYDRSD